jgi:hypothetical protein
LFVVRALAIGVLTGLLSTTSMSPQQISSSQHDPSPSQSSNMGGSATGGTFAAVYDDQKRPITAGGFVETGTVVFQDVTKAAGLWGWTHKMGTAQKKLIIEADGSGVGLIDYDNDGWLDLFMVNGHVYPQVDQHDWGTTYAERPLLFHNVKGEKGRRFEYVPPVKGTGMAILTSGRGAAFGDLFNNGKIDVIISPIDGPPTLLRNVNADHHHWVELNLIGGPKSPRDAMCATVYLKANGMRMRQDVLSSGSFISSNDQRPHFGLGDATDAGTAEIHWPSGAIETVKLPTVDRIYTIDEGRGITAALCNGIPCKFSGSKP